MEKGDAELIRQIIKSIGDDVARYKFGQPFPDDARDELRRHVEKLRVLAPRSAKSIIESLARWIDLLVQQYGADGVDAVKQNIYSDLSAIKSQVGMHQSADAEESERAPAKGPKKPQ